MRIESFLIYNFYIIFSKKIFLNYFRSFLVNTKLFIDDKCGILSIMRFLSNILIGSFHNLLTTMSNNLTM